MVKIVIAQINGVRKTMIRGNISNLVAAFFDLTLELDRLLPCKITVQVHDFILNLLRKAGNARFEHGLFAIWHSFIFRERRRQFFACTKDLQTLIVLGDAKRADAQVYHFVACDFKR